jgi:hypothetical protein
MYQAALIIGLVLSWGVLHVGIAWLVTSDSDQPQPAPRKRPPSAAPATEASSAPALFVPPADPADVDGRLRLAAAWRASIAPLPARELFADPPVVPGRRRGRHRAAETTPP